MRMCFRYLAGKRMFLFFSNAVYRSWCHFKTHFKSLKSSTFAYSMTGKMLLGSSCHIFSLLRMRTNTRTPDELEIEETCNMCHICDGVWFFFCLRWKGSSFQQKKSCMWLKRPLLDSRTPVTRAKFMSVCVVTWLGKNFIAFKVIGLLPKRQFCAIASKVIRKSFACTNDLTS